MPQICYSSLLALKVESKIIFKIIRQRKSSSTDVFNIVLLIPKICDSGHIIEKLLINPVEKFLKKFY